MLLIKYQLVDIFQMDEIRTGPWKRPQSALHSLFVSPSPFGNLHCFPILPCIQHNIDRFSNSCEHMYVVQWIIILKGPSRGSWIYNYPCIQCISPLKLWVRIPLVWGVLDTTLCDKVCQWLATCRWFSPGTPVSSANKTDCHDIVEILLKVALNTIILTLTPMNIVDHAT